tara:strand:+ start:13026 stop:13205 length:180 start_codon:yes stop_codon:yes gene_type:complete
MKDKLTTYEKSIIHLALSVLYDKVYNDELNNDEKEHLDHAHKRVICKAIENIETNNLIK